MSPAKAGDIFLFLFFKDNFSDQPPKSKNGKPNPKRFSEPPVQKSVEISHAKNVPNNIKK
jgi:hypothetical protein